MKRKISKNCMGIVVFLGLLGLPFSGYAQTTYSQSSGTVTKTEQTYNSTTDDLSAVKVTGGTLNLSNSTVSSSGSTSSSDNSSFYGLNAVILAYTASGTAVINSSGNTVSSSGTGANGIFAYGTASITTTGDKFNHTGGGGHAIMSSGGGVVTVKNDTAVTSGSSSSVIATDRGGGTITVTGGTYTANGTNSAALYSTGDITCTDATLIANAAEALVIEGANYITVNNCAVQTNHNKWGALVYQSGSGDASGTDGYLSMTGGSFTYTGTDGGMFYNTNSTAYISLDGVTLVNSCDTLARVLKAGWGNTSTASSGGSTHFTAKRQTLSGLFYVDASSDLYLRLQDNSSFSGAINPGNKADLANLIIDATSTWNVTETSYLSVVSDTSGISDDSATNITGNGYNVYYDCSLSGNSLLNSQTYKLRNGGYLTCSGTNTSANSLTTNSTSISIFPNPANDILNITTNNASEQQLSICNIYGIKVYSGTVTENQTIDVSQFGNGFYLVSIGGKTTRLIVAH